mmetsp:Transcript_11615/g.31200  ORF Transcript_11615/g.31200 Transcript_11615/m.31200 type:complete len:1527 (-) Transcript_11615:239-4819(-)
MDKVPDVMAQAFTAPRKSDFAAAAVAAGVFTTAYITKELVRGSRAKKRQIEAEANDATTAADVAKAATEAPQRQTGIAEALTSPRGGEAFDVLSDTEMLAAASELDSDEGRVNGGKTTHFQALYESDDPEGRRVISVSPGGKGVDYSLQKLKKKKKKSSSFRHRAISFKAKFEEFQLEERKKNFLGTTKFVSFLDEADAQKLFGQNGEKAEWLDFREGETLFSAGDSSESGIFVVFSGCLGVFTPVAGAKRGGDRQNRHSYLSLTHTLRMGDSIGEVDVIDGRVRDVTVRAIHPGITRVVRLTRDALLRFSIDNPRAFFYYLKNILGRQWRISQYVLKDYLGLEEEKGLYSLLPPPPSSFDHDEGSSMHIDTRKGVEKKGKEERGEKEGGEKEESEKRRQDNAVGEKKEQQQPHASEKDSLFDVLPLQAGDVLDDAIPTSGDLAFNADTVATLCQAFDTDQLRWCVRDVSEGESIYSQNDASGEGFLLVLSGSITAERCRPDGGIEEEEGDVGDAFSSMAGAGGVGGSGIGHGRGGGDREEGRGDGVPPMRRARFQSFNNMEDGDGRWEKQDHDHTSDTSMLTQRYTSPCVCGAVAYLAGMGRNETIRASAVIHEEEEEVEEEGSSEDEEGRSEKGRKWPSHHQRQNSASLDDLNSSKEWDRTNAFGGVTVAFLTEESLEILSKTNPLAAASLFHRFAAFRLSPSLRQFSGMGLSITSFMAGEEIFREGETASGMYVITSGRVRFFKKRDGVETGRGEAVAEFGRGDMIGFSAMFSKHHDTSALCIRDVEAVKIPRIALEKRVNDNPRAQARLMSQLLAHYKERITRAGADFKQGRLSTGSSAFKHDLVTIAIVPLFHPSKMCSVTNVNLLSSFTDGLKESLAKIGQTTVLTKEMIAPHVGFHTIARLDKFFYRSRVSSWITQREEESRFVVMEAENEDSAWSQLCVHQADLVLLVGDGTSPAFGLSTFERSLIWTKDGDAFGPSVLAPIELVLLHPPFQSHLERAGLDSARNMSEKGKRGGGGQERSQDDDKEGKKRGGGGRDGKNKANPNPVRLSSIAAAMLRRRISSGWQGLKGKFKSGKWLKKALQTASKAIMEGRKGFPKELPSNTEKWLRVRPFLRRHHHVRVINESDSDRVARWIADLSVGLVLGGGGSRGLAHLGVIKALEDHGIPVDMVGGTSQGAFMGSVFAGCLESKRMAPQVYLLSHFMGSTMQLMRDLTLPMLSVFSGAGFKRILSDVLTFSCDIEDLWIRYFCITTNMTKLDKEVHTTGKLWKLVMASMTVVGLLPPVYHRGELLVDGGYVDNLPTDVMRRMGARLVIAVDVESKENELFENCTPIDGISGWRILLNKYFPSLFPLKLPTKNEIERNLAYIAHYRQQKAAMEELKTKGAYRSMDLYLRPPIQRFALLDYAKLEEIVRLAYDNCYEQIRAFKEAGGLEEVGLRHLVHPRGGGSDFLKRGGKGMEESPSPLGRGGMDDSHDGKGDAEGGGRGAGLKKAPRFSSVVGLDALDKSKAIAMKKNPYA